MTTLYFAYWIIFNREPPTPHHTPKNTVRNTTIIFCPITQLYSVLEINLRWEPPKLSVGQEEQSPVTRGENIESS